MGRLFLIMVVVGNFMVLGLGMALWFLPPEMVHKVQAVCLITYSLVSSMAGLWFYDIGLRERLKELDE